MASAKETLRTIFTRLDTSIAARNEERRRDGLLGLHKAEIIILGQMSLLAQDEVVALLTLTQTADLDARLKMDHVIKQELKKLLTEAGLIYDEDSSLIWLPKTATFQSLFSFRNVDVKCVDAQSALVSKAVKAPDKNRILLRQALASGAFPDLPKLIVENGGKLEHFL